MKTSKSLFAISGLLLLAALFFYLRETTLILPQTTTETLDKKLQSSAQQGYDRQLQKIQSAFDQGEISLEEATRRREDAKVLRSHDLDQIQNGVHNCPETDGWQNGRKDLVLTECGNGTTIWIQLPNSFKETKFKASLYKKGEGGRLVQLAIKPVIEVVDPKDGFSQAVEISPTGSISPVDYKVRGDIKFTTLGADADVLVLELIK